MTADSLREKFLDFFKSKKHKIIASDSLVPADDPTVLFTPAGMNQFKKEFLGSGSGLKRAASSQRCLRTDDLEKVGKTPYHHTFFEMLGNFSFGDYFKQEAIPLAWEFLTEELKIEKEKLWVSVYKDDAESYNIWKELIKVPAAKIVKLGDKENFWPSEAKAKGPNGPCGPCSEIFVDQGKDVGCGEADCSPACDCGRFSEVWNLVFTQFNRKPDGTLEPLPKKNIDTGMGLERLAAVMQGVKSNFETDLFQPIVKEVIAEVKGSPNLPGNVYPVADHIRAIVFAIYDGVLPSNEGRGYVVRKLIRKSRMHLWGSGITRPFLYKLVPIVSEIMQAPYPELSVRRENISEIILAEEKNFISTFNSSESLFKDKFQQFIDNPNPVEAGKTAFLLYDTYGMPLELTREWLQKNGIKISQEAFNQELETQKSRSKAESAMQGDVFAGKDVDLGVKATKFLGYKEVKTKAKVLKIIEDGIILDRTPFYPEGGGQAGDSGKIIKGKNLFEVTDTVRQGKVIIHRGKIKAGSFKKGDAVAAEIDFARRMDIARNHTATHLLQAALRKVLGAHVQQQGSMVAAEKLRFDFTHFKDIAEEELNRTEALVNDYILNNHGLTSKEMTLSMAKKSGALAFFGEKYESKVRVVSVGDFSQELCGGTHLDSCGQIGTFKIIQEGTVASGVRRIEAVTGKNAYRLIKEEEGIVSEIASMLNVPAQRIAAELEKKLSQIKEMEKQLNSRMLDSVRASADELISGAETINGKKLITKIMGEANIDLLRKTVDMLKEKAENSVIVLGSNSSGRALLVLGVTNDLCLKGLDASRLIITAAKIIGGSGGGRKDFAQAGGNKPENFQQAFAELKKVIGELK